MKHAPLIATALFLAGVTPVSAQNDPASAPADAEMAAAGPAGALIRAEAVEDASVYSLGETYDETYWDSGEPFGPLATAWNEIGEVEDLILSNDAEVVGVTVDVGGFLGIGERTVLLPIGDIRLVQLPENEGFFIVTRMTEEQLEAADDVEGVIGDD